MRIKSKIVQIPNNSTITQIETALDNWLNKGWELKQVFALGTSTYAVLVLKVAV